MTRNLLLLLTISTIWAAGAEPAVPAVVTMPTQFQKVMIVRLKNGTDILEGLREAVAKEKIKNAVILAGIGSVTQSSFHLPVTKTFPPKDEMLGGSEVVDVISANGYVIGGRVHAHVTFSDKNRAVGGHLEPGSKVYTFIAITLGVLDDKVDLSQIDNWKWR